MAWRAHQRTMVKARPEHGNTREWTSLNEEHVLGPARNVNKSELRLHIVVDHAVSVKDCKTQADFGRLHLLIHSCIAHPMLADLLDVDWGKK